jgi:hypothetical protein
MVTAHQGLSAYQLVEQTRRSYMLESTIVAPNFQILLARARDGHCSPWLVEYALLSLTFIQRCQRATISSYAWKLCLAIWIANALLARNIHIVVAHHGLLNRHMVYRSSNGYA